MLTQAAAVGSTSDTNDSVVRLRSEVANVVEQGSVIAGRYRLDHVLGEGGMGAVWAATHVMTRKRVAIKLLKADVATPETLRRFIREARAASAVRHPNVVEIHDFLSLEDGSPAMVMDLLEGETLAERLARVGALPMAELSSIMAPVLSAVGSAHAAGVVHRDLKPDNIFLAQLGDGRTEPMVLDFGIAKVLPFEETLDSSEPLTETGAVVGTPYYMAPEQAFGEKDGDARIDVWALGVILYECATGKKPIIGETLGQVFKSITTGNVRRLAQTDPQLPQAFTALVDRMLSRDREQRPRDLREPFGLLRDMSGVNVRSFGPAAFLAAPGVSVRAELRPRAIFGAGVGLTLLAVTAFVALRSHEATSPVSAVETAAVAAPVVTPPPSSPPPETPPPAPTSVANAPNQTKPKSVHPRASARAMPSLPALDATPPPPAPAATAAEKQLPGGVNGSIPF